VQSERGWVCFELAGRRLLGPRGQGLHKANARWAGLQLLLAGGMIAGGKAPFEPLLIGLR